MNTQKLVAEIRRKESFLCVGLDVDIDRIPKHLLKEDDPIFAFNKAIIDATQEYAVSFKPNIAFYEAYGLEGWKSLERTIAYINEKYPEIFTIADAKRGDIGNTSTRYAEAFLRKLNFDSITVAPYMGRDSVEPFLEFTDKHTILLAYTSNKGADDFQNLKVDELPLHLKVIETSKSWKNSENLMYVVGATKAGALRAIREIIPNSFLLVPGVGAQGGSLKEVCENALTDDVGLLINSSRGIIYASQGTDYAEAAQAEAKKLQQQMKSFL